MILHVYPDSRQTDRAFEDSKVEGVRRVLDRSITATDGTVTKFRTVRSRDDAHCLAGYHIEELHDHGVSLDLYRYLLPLVRKAP